LFSRYCFRHDRHLDDRQIANGDAQLSFLLTIDDTADTGTIWETTLTLAGTTNGAAAEVSVNPAGRITFSTAANRMDLLQLDIGPITQVSGPAGTTAVFNGFDVIGMDQFNANNDLFDFGGDSYVGNVDGDTSNNASETFATQSLAPSGSLFDNTGAGQWRLEVISSQFDVSIATVPEPSSVVLVSLLGLSFLRRKRVYPPIRFEF